VSSFANRAEGFSRLSNGLRKPLALIQGYADLLTLEPDDETLADAPERIKEAATELTRVVDDLLTVYAIDVGVLYLAPTPTPVAVLVGDAAAAARERGTRLTIDAAERAAAASVQADPEHLSSMLTTLVENARNRTANAGAIIHVERSTGYVEIEVGDHGGALDEEELRVAFDAFSTLTPRTGLSTGLELYKVRRLAELQKGHVWARNTPNGETGFGFALPLARGPQ
jgi:signal transduction histidine kinase